MAVFSPTPATSHRTSRAFACRTSTAGHDAFAPAPAQIDNGDEERYADKSGTYTKGILQLGVGVVDLAAYDTFKKALSSGSPTDFSAIKTGGPRTQNGPQGGLAFDLECPDASQFTSPPAPRVASEEYAAELVELYWGALLRDVPFGRYGTDGLADMAVSELSGLAGYKGPKTGGNVTAGLLFRGSYPSTEKGPYLSQFMIKDAKFGALPITQKYVPFAPGQDFMRDQANFLKVQNGQPTPESITRLPNLQYLQNGRALAAYTHEDVLYQAYFAAYLVISELANRLKLQPGDYLNPGNPYLNYPNPKTQNGFDTFGDPDFAATIASVARQALNAVWYQKWFVHLRHRPESGGGLVWLIKNGQGGTVKAQPTTTVLNSMAVQKTGAGQNGTFFLPQAFPEGSPTHPAYPTGHGAVAGACITALKFFFKNDYKFPANEVFVPSDDGGTRTQYTGADAADLELHSELNKLAYNVSFGHGIHAGIHWRSDTETSIRLGEQVALSVLRDRAHTYNEKFTVRLTTLDGGTAVISNE